VNRIALDEDFSVIRLNRAANRLDDRGLAAPLSPITARISFGSSSKSEWSIAVTWP